MDTQFEYIVLIAFSLKIRYILFESLMYGPTSQYHIFSGLFFRYFTVFTEYNVLYWIYI